MDEGKPTKPKWWSHPRPHEPGAGAESQAAGGDVRQGPGGGQVSEGSGGGAEPRVLGGEASPQGMGHESPPALGGDRTEAAVVGVPEGPGSGDAPEAVGADSASAVNDRDPAQGAAAYGTSGHDAQALGTAAHDTPTPPYGTPTPSYGDLPSAVPARGPGPQPPHHPEHHLAQGSVPPQVPPQGSVAPQVAPQGPVPPQVPTQVSGSQQVRPQGPVPQQVPPQPPIPQQAPPQGPVPEQALPQGEVPQPASVHDAVPAPQPQPHIPQGLQPQPQPTSVSGGPWQQYDPWRAAPLQQNGSVQVSPEQRRKRARRVLVIGSALIALVSGGVGGAIGAYLERNGGVSEVQLPQADAESSDRAPGSVAGIAASALPSVVTLHVSGAEEQGTGTGFVLDGKGHILTNNHVVEPAGTGGDISVTFSGGQTAQAEVVGRDSGYDLAVVKVSGVSGLKPLPLGNSDNVRVGDPVVAIGAPFDLANTVTSGIISAKERPITAGGEKGDGSDISYVDALQTDAPINPGNSGGPLVDSKARVIGINSAIRSADSGSGLDGGQAGSIGLGFAIPINQGKRVAEELINTGKATHPVIGVTLDMDYSGDGARVAAKGNDGGSPVNEGGPGDKAGITAGDVITEVDGQRVHSGEELIVKIRAHRPGDRLELTLKRDGNEKKVTLVLGSSEGD
ncbi:trypsin-like peptidase domain-containing protein [Streptomyces sp. PSKA54]|uniref:Trypsin-like peptidase domain-containing protein n=1 Tax=Streptomyces himalayensis subsp. aureolus TaxID=2758039 RepID=A0A7W2HJC7_9ACTN|nr:trypsin-like peptidase domain-containing protein [Streptomyces himalayensis]MBA4865709.1 trypsin-like peptidase domain-containing protein [Streptomyces himalayensis subsp. aureolus]